MSQSRLQVASRHQATSTKLRPWAFAAAVVGEVALALLAADNPGWWPLLLVLPALWIAQNQGAIVAIALTVAALGPLWFYSQRGSAGDMLWSSELPLFTTIALIILCAFALDGVAPAAKEADDWQLPVHPETLTERKPVPNREKRRNAA